MNFIRQDYHTDRDRRFYITSAGWNRSAYVADAFRYAFEKHANYKADVAASESLDNQLLRDIWGNWVWNWSADEEKEINPASNGELGEFLFGGVA